MYAPISLPETLTPPEEEPLLEAMDTPDPLAALSPGAPWRAYIRDHTAYHTKVLLLRPLVLEQNDLLCKSADPWAADVDIPENPHHAHVTCLRSWYSSTRKQWKRLIMPRAGVADGAARSSAQRSTSMRRPLWSTAVSVALWAQLVPTEGGAADSWTPGRKLTTLHLACARTM
jgi:hypothetical protein